MHLKLRRGMSYNGAVTATKKTPDVYVDDEALAGRLVASGYFAVIEEETATAEGDVPEVIEEETATAEDSLEALLKAMKKAELAAYASEKGIDISGCRTNDEKIQAILRAADNAKAAREALREE